jgi:integrase
VSVRNPKAPGWPEMGERTEDEEVARRWAWAHLDHVRGEVKDRQLGRPKSKPLGAALEAYCAQQKRTSPLTTIRGQHASLAALEDRFGARTPLARITTARLQELLDELTDAGYAPRTIAFTKAVWSGFFRAQGEGYNPARALVVPLLTVPEQVNAWSLEQWRKVRERAQKYRGCVPIVQILDFAVCTGGRINEVLALCWEDFHPLTGTVRIARAYEPGYTTVRAPKGSRGYPKARTALCLPELWTYGYDFAQRGLAILKEDEPVNVNRAGQVFKPILQNLRLGGPGRRFHDCRDTYIRQWLERGALMAEVQRWVGHASITTTEKAYPAFTAEQAAENAMRRLYPRTGRRRA